MTQLSLPPPGVTVESLWKALVEIDTYLAHDPESFNRVSVAKVGDVLCDTLGGDVVRRINAGYWRTQIAALELQLDQARRLVT